MRKYLKKIKMINGINDYSWKMKLFQKSSSTIGTIGIQDKRDPIYGTIGILKGQKGSLWDIRDPGQKGSYLWDKGILKGQ